MASAWSTTPEWGSLMNVLHDPFAQGQLIGVSTLDRQVVSPSIIWQWQCLRKQDIGFLPYSDAVLALDTLRFGTLNETLRAQCEAHFLSYFPQCKPEADIAFSLGAPLALTSIDVLNNSLPEDLLEPCHEALHSI
jgi:hypothetical protein